MRRLRHTAFLAIVLAACSSGEIVPGVRDSTFVAAMADLRRAEATAESTSELAASRRRILQQRGLTAEQLESAARTLGDDPERALAIWRAIDKRAVNMPADTSRRH